MKKIWSHCLALGVLAAVTAPAASPAMAQATACGTYQPGLIGFLSSSTRPATCVYQGPYMVNQGPVYDGPALIAPHRTYAQSRTINSYVHGEYRVAAPARAVRYGAVKRRAMVNVRNEPRLRGSGKPQVVRADAEVRIYGPRRMEIRLYRR